jgi:HSP20 family protein
MADIIRRRPLGLSRRFGWPFSSLVDDMLTSLEPEARLAEGFVEGRFVPAVDIAEDSDAVTITAEVPGMTKEDLDVSIEDGVLTLRGEKKSEGTSEGKDFHRVERLYGRFERRIQLPQNVDAEKVTAGYQDGVLKLTMPKVAAAKARSIRIE